MAVVNKYNIHWQIVRVKAKDIKDVDDKLAYVIGWYKSYPSKQNYERVKKWLIMSPLGYKEQSIKKLYKQTLDSIKSSYMMLPDQNNQFDKYKHESLLKVYKDLKKRKYNFQYNGAPKTHTIFMQQLKEYLNL